MNSMFWIFLTSLGGIGGKLLASWNGALSMVCSRLGAVILELQVDAVQGGASVEPVVRVGDGWRRDGNVVGGSRGSRLAREAGSAPRGERGVGGEYWRVTIFATEPSVSLFMLQLIIYKISHD